MKIAYLSSSIIPSEKANSVHVIRMCSALAHSFKVTLFSRNAPKNNNDIFHYYGENSHFQIIKNNWPPVHGLGGIIYGLRTRKSLRQINPPDLLYGRDIYSLFFLSHLGIPIVFESHSPPKNYLHYFMEFRLIKYRNFKKLIVISENLKKIYTNIFPRLNDNNIIVAHDAANDPLGKTIPSIALPGRKNVVKAGYIGSFNSGRGISLIIKLAKKIPEIDFHLIGGATFEVEKYKSLSGSSNIFFHGYVLPGLVQAYLTELDILLAPYQEKVSVDGYKGDTSKWMSPMKIFEYMSHGKAIISSDLPVLREVLSHNDNCILCHPSDLNQWVSSIKQLAGDKNFQKFLGHNARQRFLAKHTWPKRAEILSNILYDK